MSLSVREAVDDLFAFDPDVKETFPSLDRMKMSRRRRRNNNASLAVPKTMTSLVKCLGGVVFQLLQKSTDVALTVTGIEREEAVVEICSTVFSICSSLGFVECTQDHILTVKIEPAKDLLCQLFNVSPSCLPSCPTGPVMSAGIIFAETKINIPRKRIGEEAKQSLDGQPSLTLPSTRASSIELLDDEAQEAEFVQVDGNSLQEMMESSLDHHGVIFKDIAEKYASDGDIYCRFVHKTWPKREGDEVGVFPISFKYLSDALVCKPVSSAVTEASGDCKIVFPASLFFGLNLEGEFLQFCYLSGPEVKGASTPFRIFRPQEEEMREVAQEDDGDFVILKSKDALFQEQMDQLRSEKGSAISERDRVMRDLEKANKMIGEKDLEIKQKDKHLALLNYKVEDLENELTKQRQEFQEHKDKVRTTYNDILSVKEEEYTEVAKELHKIQVEHDSAKQMIAIKEKENNDLCLHINQLKAQANDLEKSLKEEKEVSRLLKSELDAATGTVQSLSTSLEKTSMERDSEKDKMKDLEKQVSNLTLRLKVAAEEYEKKGKECVRLEGKYNRLQEKINVSSLIFHSFKSNVSLFTSLDRRLCRPPGDLPDLYQHHLQQLPLTSFPLLPIKLL